MIRVIKQKLLALAITILVGNFCVYANAANAALIEEILNENNVNPIISKYCKTYDRDKLTSFIALGKQYLKKAQSEDGKAAIKSFTNYIVILNILENDRIIETTHSMRNDGFELGQQLGPLVSNLIKRNIIKNNFKDTADFYDNVFLHWSKKSIKNKCGFKF